MSILDRLEKKGQEEPGDPVIARVREHLQRMHGEFRSSPRYANSAPYWRRLEHDDILEWVVDCVKEGVRTGRKVTRTRRWSDCLVVATFVHAFESGKVRDAFAPHGYLGELEREGFFDAPRERIPAASIVIGSEGYAMKVHVTWFPPLDGKGYQVVLAQDILTPAERQEVGI